MLIWKRVERYLTDGKQRQKVAGKYSEGKESKISALFPEYKHQSIYQEEKGRWTGIRKGSKGGK